LSRRLNLPHRFPGAVFVLFFLAATLWAQPPAPSPATNVTAPGFSMDSMDSTATADVVAQEIPTAGTPATGGTTVGATTPSSNPGNGLALSVKPGQESVKAGNGPMKIQVGMYIIDVARLDVKDSQFYADFYIWYKWKNQPDFVWNPENIEFMNGTIEFTDKLATDSFGDIQYASQRIKGVFRGSFNLRSYPLDSQLLPISIEDSQTPLRRLVFEPDPNNPDQRRWLAAGIQVPDWEVSGAEAAVNTFCYDTDFGDSFTTNEKQTFYSRFHFRIKLKRLFIPHVIKFIIPLLVIAGMAYLVFFINAKEFEAQCGICVTALLTAVALHISQAEALPAVGYLVISDKVFILFYLSIFSALVQTVMANNYAKTGNIEMAARLDNAMALFFPLMILLGIIFIVFT
jgi:hypothetical protein